MRMLVALVLLCAAIGPALAATAQDTKSKDIPMASTCRFIAGDPADAFHLGEQIYCGRPVARADEAWCAEHRAIVYEPIRPAAVKRPTESRYVPAEPRAQAA